MRKLLVAVFGLTVVFLLLAACGGGGASGPSGFTPLLTTGGDQNNSPPVEGDDTLEAVDVEPPQVAKSAGEIGGVVADYVGRPIPDLEVYLDSTGNVVSSTDDSGEFLASGVASGNHSLVIGVEGIEVASFDVSYDDALPLNMALSPSGARTVSEYSDYGTLVGVVTDTEGTPLEGVKVLAFNNDRFFLLARTNADGEYEFARIPAGEYRLIGFKRGYRTYVGEVAIHAGETTRHDFVMRGYDVGRVIGTVRDEEGTPLPRTHVFLLYRDREDDDRNPPAFHTMTGPEGHYAFNDVPAGGADMLAFKPGYMPEDAEVVVPPMGHIVQDFVLHGYPPPPPPPPAYAILTGLVHSGPVDPIGGALVELIRGDLYFSTESNDEGFYRFDELPIGEYVFEVSAEGYEGIRGELRLLPGHNIRNFFLPPEPPLFGFIEGTVFSGESEEPVPGALVELWVPGAPGDMHKIRETETNQHGRFGFPEVPPGWGVIKAFKEDAGGDIEYFLEPGDAIEVTVRIFPGHEWNGKIIGRTRIVDPENPDRYINIPCVEVVLFYGPPDEGNPPMRVTHSNENGIYVFEGLPPTEDEMQYVLVAHKFMEGMMWEGVEDTPLGEDQVVELHITLHPQGPPPEFGSVHGVVWRMIEDGEEHVPGALVLLFHGEPGGNNPPIREGHSNEDGWYGFPELPPSGDMPYVVVAKKDYGEVQWEGAKPFHLGPGEEMEVHVQIFPPGPPPGRSTIGGRIFRQNPESPAGPPLCVPGAAVKLYRGDPDENEPIRTTESNEQGLYHFFGLPPSGDVPYVVVAHKWIQEVYYYGLEDTYLGDNEFKELHVWVWPNEY